MKHASIVCACLAVVVAAGPVLASDAAPCSPPPGFVDTPAPEVADMGELVSRVEEIRIDRPLPEVLEAVFSASLEDVLDPDSPLPHVTGTYELTAGKFHAPGSRRLVCLSDDSTVVEQVLVQRTSDDSHRFRYVVWNYTTEAAEPIDYGVGEFIYTGIDEELTHMKWTYSFMLKDDHFPGYLGWFGGWLFRVTFLDRQYAQMMRGTLARMKAIATR